MDASFLFVYGTLRSDSPRKSPVKNALHQYADRLCNATTRGCLYKIDWYPGLVASENPDDVVKGELYKIKDESKLFSHLDKYEGCSEDFPDPHEYQRVKRLVQTENQNKVMAWVYLYNREIDEALRISSGDYLNP